MARQLEHRVDLTQTYGNIIDPRKASRSVLLANPNSQVTNETADVPEVIYRNNVIPTVEGYSSVKYDDLQAALASPNNTTAITDAIRINTDDGDQGLLLVEESGELHFLDSGTYITSALSLATSVRQGFTFGLVNSTTYVHRSYAPTTHLGITTVDSAGALTTANITGSPLASNIRGIVGSFGYLICWGSDGEISWSSTIDPLDHAPSPTTGAGTGFVSEVDGEIVTCIATDKGFLIFCDNNIVAATYTGNVKYPFKFKALPNSSGLAHPSLVSHNHMESEQYAYTKAGMAKITQTTFELILPEIKEFVDTGSYVNYNTSTNVFDVINTVASYNTESSMKVRVVASRYLVISWSINYVGGVTDAPIHFIYDLQLGRLGQLTYASSVEIIAKADMYESSNDDIALVTNTGAIKEVNWLEATTSRDGILILGRYQYMRNRQLVMHSVEVESIAIGESLTCTDLYSYDGAVFSALAMIEKITNTVRRYLTKRGGKTHTIVLSGSFSLKTLLLKFSIGGSNV